MNLFSCTIENIISFVVKRFKDGFKYRTFNSHGSANSTFHPKIDEFQAAKYPIICTVLTEIFNQRPQKPRYPFVLDAKVLLDFIGSNRSWNKDL